MDEKNHDVQEVIDRLATLEPTAADRPRSAAQALAQVRQRIDQYEQNRFWSRLRRFLAAPQRRVAYAGLAAVLLFVLAFSFPTVRAAASDFLGLFRVQKFAAISISPEQIALLEEVANSGLTPGEVEIVNQPGAASEASSLRQAQSLAGLETVRTLSALGPPDSILVTEGGNGFMRVNLEGARAIVAAAGADPALLPDSLDGARVDVVVFNSVEQRWADGTSLMQTASPLVEYPDNVDPTVLGEALLQVLGLNEAEAGRLARSIDWTGTLLLPIPQDVASFNEVTVNGVSGMLLNSYNGSVNALLWQQDGILYLLVSPAETADLVDMAHSLR